MKKKVTSHSLKFASIETFLILEVSQYCKWAGHCLQQVASNCSRLGNALPGFVCACLSYLSSCAGLLPQKLCHWIFSQSLWLSSWIAFWSDCHMTGRGLNLDSNMNFASWPMGCKGLSALNSHNKLSGVWILFRSVENAEIEDSCELIPTLIHQTGMCKKIYAFLFFYSNDINLWLSCLIDWMCL